MIEISISRDGFDNGAEANKFLKQVISYFEELGLNFGCGEFYITLGSVTFEDKNSQANIRLGISESSDTGHFDASVKFFADTFGDFDKLIELIENIASAIPEVYINALLAKHDGQKLTHFVIHFDDDKNTLDSYDKLKAFIKRKIAGKVFVAHKEEEILCEKQFSPLEHDREFILREIGTGREFSTHLDVSKSNCNCNSSVYMNCGQGYRKFTVSAWGKTVQNAFENFGKKLSDRGYEIVKFPKVQDES